MHCLLIDDHPPDRECVMQALQQTFPAATYSVVTHRQEFAAALAHGQFTVAITEYQLHWSNGLAVLRALQEVCPRVPVLLCTHTADVATAVEAMQAGASDYVLKTELARLPQAVTAACERIRQQTLRPQAEEEQGIRAQQQAGVVALGQQALSAIDLSTLLQHAVALVTQTLAVDYGEIMEWVAREHVLRFRAGIGWPERFRNRAYIDDSPTSQAGYALQTNAPVMVQDLQTEQRFSGALLQTYQVRSGVSVLIGGPPHPFGVLGIHAKRRRIFTADDVHFLQAVANVLAQSIAHRQVVEALQQSEARLRQIIDLVPADIYARDHAGHFLLANRAAAAAFGMTPQALQGKTVLDVMPEPAEARAALRDDQQVLASGQPLVRAEEPQTDVNGRQRILHTTRLPFVHAGTQEAAVLGIALDRTDHKRAEETLRAEARFLRAQTDVATLALTSQPPDVLATHVLAAICRAQAYAYGFFWRLNDDQDVATVVASYGNNATTFLGYRQLLTDPDTVVTRLLRTGQPGFYNDIQSTSFARHPISRLCGGKAIVGFPLCDRQGKSIGALVFGDTQDPARFTERDVQQGTLLAHQVAQALESSALVQQMQHLQEQYHVVMDNLQDAVYLVDADGRVVFANAALERLTGYTKDELLGRPSTRLYPSESVPQVVERRIRALRGEEVSPYLELKLLRKDGQHIHTELSVVNLPVDGKIRGRVVVARDLTRRLYLEAQLRQAQKMQAIGTLTGGIAHDFNNILTAIMGYTELVLEDLPADGLLRQNLSHVLTAGERAKALVQQMLTFSRRSEQERQAVQMPLLVEEVLALIRAVLPTTVSLRHDIDPSAGIVLAEPTQLHQVLLNLCTNAEHAMRQTGGALTVRLRAVALPQSLRAAHPELASGMYVCLTVHDTGYGMTPEVLEHIFEPFFTTKPQGEGTGLGLAVVYDIVKSHGGAITVESQPQAGTTFTIYLPQSARGLTAPSSTSLSTPMGKERILFVDDEESLALLGQVALSRLGYEVSVYTSSIAALEAFRATPDLFDLAITDYTMPQMTGEDLARELRRVRPNLPIIMCTGFSHTMTAEKAQLLGLDAFCMKPLGAHDLGLKVRQVFAQRAARQA